MQLQNAKVNNGLRVYAIGDIHGCFNELKALIKKIDYNESSNPSENHKLIFLGDYVDRGPANQQVMDFLIKLSKSKRDTVFLKGNHDDRFECFIEEPTKFGDQFMRWGGGPTLRDYNVIPQHGESYSSIAERLERKMPKEHRAFLKKLEFSYTVDDYFFSHAGIKPGIELEQQQNDDLMWARESFLTHTEPYEKIIVHGHTICDQPEIMHNRINIDTGCYQSGKLTALVLEDDRQSFIQT